MLLVEARADQVVRNRKNSSYYRFVGPVDQRVRIRPLELFPNGLLIEKTADTIVDADLEVDAIGMWSDEFFVEDSRTARLQGSCEVELKQKLLDLVALEAEYQVIDPSAHGGKGSHANKIKAVAGRIAALERGLAERTGEVRTAERQVEPEIPVFADRSLVQLPSGLPALVMETFNLPSDTRPYAKLRAKASDGSVVDVSVVQECLRPYEHRFMATV